MNMNKHTLLVATVAMIVATGTALAQTSTVTKEVVVKTTGANGTTIQTGTQTTPLTLILPTTAGAVNQGMVVTNVSGNTVTLGWPASGEASVLRVKKSLTTDHALGNGNVNYIGNAWTVVGSNGGASMSATVTANTSYRLYAVLLITLTGDGTNGANSDAFVNLRLNFPSGTYNATMKAATDNNGHDMTVAYANATSLTQMTTQEAQDAPQQGTTPNIPVATIVLEGYVDIGGTGGTLSVEMAKSANNNAANFTVGQGSFMILER